MRISNGIQINKVFYTLESFVYYDFMIWKWKNDSINDRTRHTFTMNVDGEIEWEAKVWAL